MNKDYQNPVIEVDKRNLVVRMEYNQKWCESSLRERIHSIAVFVWRLRLRTVDCNIASFGYTFFVMKTPNKIGLERAKTWLARFVHASTNFCIISVVDNTVGVTHRAASRWSICKMAADETILRRFQCRLSVGMLNGIDDVCSWQAPWQCSNWTPPHCRHLFVYSFSRRLESGNWYSAVRGVDCVLSFPSFHVPFFIFSSCQILSRVFPCRPSFLSSFISFSLPFLTSSSFLSSPIFLLRKGIVIQGRIARN